MLPEPGNQDATGRGAGGVGLAGRGGRFALTLLLLCSAAIAQAPRPIRGAHYPALSPDGKRLCFEYRGDLWTVPSSGGAATRLTVNRAYSGYPRWSPDGNWIAFSSNRFGNFDVFLIPARGGDSRRITYNSAEDFVLDWSPDGSQILFASARDTRTMDLYAITVKDGRSRRITNDRTACRYASYSPDGRTIAYTRGRQDWWRPRYRGSANAEVWTIPAAGGKSTRLTAYDGWDAWPLYSVDGTSIYFVSAHDRASNLWRMGPDGRNPVQLTHYRTGDVRYPTIARDGSAIAYEYDFDLWLLPLEAQGVQALRHPPLTPPLPRGGQGGVPPAWQGRVPAAWQGAVPHRPRSESPVHPFTPTPLRIFARGDVKYNQVERVTLTSGASSPAVSPDGKTLAFGARGEIWTCAADGGDAVRITRTPAEETSPVWSPDGSMLTYTSDRNGNLDVYIAEVKTKAEKRVTTDPADDERPQFSPDGKLLAFVRSGGSESGLYVTPLGKDFAASDPGKLVSDATRVGPGPGVAAYDWSPDGRWLVYSRRDATGTSDLWIVPSVGGTPVNVTRFPGSNSDPQWSRDGRNIVFLSSRGSESGAGGPGLYVLPMIPRPQREGPGEGDGGPETRDRAAPSPVSGLPSPPEAQEAQRRRIPQPVEAPPPGQAPQLPPPRIPPRAALVRIEFEGIQDRARALTTTGAGIGQFALCPDSRTAVYVSGAAGQAGWWAIDLVGGSTIRLTGDGIVGGPADWSPDGQRFFFAGPGGNLYQVSPGTQSASQVALSASMDVDIRAERSEAFNQAWRLLRTRFYDAKMHGADWPAIRARYEPLLSEIDAKEDFASLLSSMIGELNASHLGVTPPAGTGPAVQTASLGLRFDEGYPGPGVKVLDVLPGGPCDQLNRHVQSGEYVLSIDGQDVSWTESMWRTLEGRADKWIELTVNSKPAREGARAVRVHAISRTAADDLEYERWVRQRREKVEQLSGGRLAYIHIKAMDRPSLLRFQRELFGDAQSKEGLVLDVRFNPGGRIHDELLSLLTRKPHVYEVPRDSERSTQPFQVWNRPIILVINEYSASDAEIFPNGFRQYGLGKIVGGPTYGAVIGTSDVTLVDGTRFRVPRTGWYTLEGKDLENMGVQPDIRVEMTPEDYATDNDRQLEAAVRALLSQMTGR